MDDSLNRRRIESVTMPLAFDLYDPVSWDSLASILIVVLPIIFVLVVLLRIRGFIRRHRAPRVNARLARYSGATEEQVNADLELARSIIATSSTPRIAGYLITQQVDALLIEGHRSPDMALIAIKAEAARRGANALINLKQQRSGTGRCTAQADAVVVRAVK